MLRQNTTPIRVPSSVPVTPTEAPHIRKMRITAPRPAPSVRSTAMSRVLSFTIMISDEITLNAATRMISSGSENMTFCSTCTAAKKLLLLCCQSTHQHRASRRRAWRSGGSSASTSSGSSTRTSIW